MTTKESSNDQYGTFITGLAYTGVLAIILLLLCFIIEDNLFDSVFTFITVGVICIIFFLSGFKKVERRKLGFLIKLGKPDFENYYTQGIYWIFPFWTFEQKSDFGYLNIGDEIKRNILTSDEVPLDIKVNYSWKVKDPLIMDENFENSLIAESVEYELTNYIQKSHSIEILADEDNSRKKMIKLFEEVGESIGIVVTKVIPLIKPDEKYVSIAKNITYKYKELERELAFNQKGKKMDLEIEREHMIESFEKLGISKQDALSYLKVYKNQVNVNENTYNVNVGELNKLIESVMSFLKN